MRECPCRKQKYLRGGYFIKSLLRNKRPSLSINVLCLLSVISPCRKQKYLRGGYFIKAFYGINDLLYHCSFPRKQFIEILLKNAFQIIGHGKGQKYFAFFLGCFCVVLFFFPRFFVCVFLWFALFSNIISWVKAS